jgi:hypothetical protein
VVAIAGALERDVLAGDAAGIRTAPLRRPPHHVEEDGGELGGIHDWQSYRGASRPTPGRRGENGAMPTFRDALTPVAVAVLALAALAGCTPADDPGPEPPSSPTESAAPQPTTEPTDQPVGTPVEATCPQLVSPDTLYVYNPNFGPIDDFAPAAGSAAASALEYRGVACRWQNQTSGQNIDVSVAQLDDETLTALKNAAFADSEMVPTYGEEAYFSVEGSIGTAQVFQGPYWVVAESGVFFEPGDATEIVQSVLAGLGA